tara:strand:+ start:815 stop:1060 length:246 start_codon:yes stop_codon:yes gene_type:complete
LSLLISYQRCLKEEKDKSLKGSGFGAFISFENERGFEKIPFEFINDENSNKVSEVDLHKGSNPIPCSKIFKPPSGGFPIFC